MLKPLVIIPCYYDQNSYYEFPVGLAIMVSVLRNCGYDPEILNLNRIISQSVITTKIVNADVILTGGICTYFNAIRRIVKGAREIKPEIIAIIGGGGVTATPEIFLKETTADFAVLGEGEETLPKLMQAIEAGEMSKKIWSAPHPIKDLSTVPRPAYDAFDIDYYLNNQLTTDVYYLYPYDAPRAMTVILSRSCPYECTFCWHPMGNVYRSRPLDHFFNEVDFLLNRYDINILLILDEILGATKKRIKEFCARIKPYRVKWLPQMRVDTIDREIVETLKDSGCYYVSLGIESLSNPVLKAMNKKITREQAISALTLCHEIGVGTQGNILCFDPSETVDTALESLTWTAEHQYHHLNVNALIPYPNSELFQRFRKNGLIPDTKEFLENYCPPIQGARFSVAEANRINSVMQKILTHRDLAKQTTPICIGIHPLRKTPLFSFAMTCTNCGTTSQYRNFVKTNRRGPFELLGCKHCNQRNDLR